MAKDVVGSRSVLFLFPLMYFHVRNQNRNPGKVLYLFLSPLMYFHVRNQNRNAGKLLYFSFADACHAGAQAKEEGEEKRRHGEEQGRAVLSALTLTSARQTALVLSTACRFPFRSKRSLSQRLSLLNLSPIQFFNQTPSRLRLRPVLVLSRAHCLLREVPKFTFLIILLLSYSFGGTCNNTVSGGKARQLLLAVLSSSSTEPNPLPPLPNPLSPIPRCRSSGHLQSSQHPPALHQSTIGFHTFLSRDHPRCSRETAPL